MTGKHSFKIVTGLALALTTAAMVPHTLGGCGRTQKAGTHVEVARGDGTPIYISGAASPGVNQDIACRTAVHRAVAAVGLRFAQDNKGIAKAIANDVGSKDGEVFLQRFARERATSAAVQDVKFDPVEHLCLATVRWTAPVFVRDAVLVFAQELKERELAEAAGRVSNAEPGAQAVVQAPHPSANLPPATDSQAQPPHFAAPPQAEKVTTPPARPPKAQPSTPVARCQNEQKNLAAAKKKSRSTSDDESRCLSRGNATTCHRYSLYAKQALDAEQQAALKAVRCLNVALATSQLRALEQALPGHAAVVVETTDDAVVVLWTFAPLEQTSFAVHLSQDGTVVNTEPLAANQTQWVRERLGL